MELAVALSLSLSIWALSWPVGWQVPLYDSILVDFVRFCPVIFAVGIQQCKRWNRGYWSAIELIQKYLYSKWIWQANSGVWGFSCDKCDKYCRRVTELNLVWQCLTNWDDKLIKDSRGNQTLHHQFMGGGSCQSGNILSNSVKRIQIPTVDSTDCMWQNLLKHTWVLWRMVCSLNLQTSLLSCDKGFTSAAQFDHMQCHVNALLFWVNMTRYNFKSVDAA